MINEKVRPPKRHSLHLNRYSRLPFQVGPTLAGVIRTVTLPLDRLPALSAWE
jgi:hypothetical protein